MAWRSWRLEPLFLAILLVGCTRPNLAYGDSNGGTIGGSGGQTSTVTGSVGEASGTNGDGEGEGEAEGNGEEGDTDTDPCELDNGGCSEDALCESTGDGDVTCTCPEGWVGDGMTCNPPSLSLIRVDLACGPKQKECAEPNLCAMGTTSVEVLFSGDPKIIYELTLEVLGVVEEAPYEGGAQRDWYYEGGEPLTTFRNTYRLESDDLPLHLFLNPSPMGFELECIPLQETLALQLPGNSTLRLTASGGDSCGIRSDGLSVSGLQPRGDGQFLQLEVVSIEM